MAAEKVAAMVAAINQAFVLQTITRGNGSRAAKTGKQTTCVKFRQMQYEHLNQGLKWPPREERMAIIVYSQIIHHILCYMEQNYYI